MTNDPVVTLEPCPFCGHDDDLSISSRKGQSTRYVVCWKCEAEGPVADDNESAMAAWNTRPLQAVSPTAGDGVGYPLNAHIWKRDSEWVLEIAGVINDCAFVSRHVEPLTTAPEDVAGLPSLYALAVMPRPTAGDEVRIGAAAFVKLNRCPEDEFTGDQYMREFGRRLNQACDIIEALAMPKASGVEIAREALEAVQGAMLNGGDGAKGDFGWNITKLNKARSLVRNALTKLDGGR